MDHPEASRKPTLADKHRRFAIVPAKKRDARRLVDIEFHAFENNRVNQVLSYRDYKKASHFERSVHLYESAMMEGGEDEWQARSKTQRNRADSKCDNLAAGSEGSFLKVVDTQTHEIVSFAKVEMKTYSPQELRSPADSGHEGESRMNRDWFALNERLRREYVGLAKHCYIGMLATKPLHQHHGAGTLLLEQILAAADAAGVEVYLEATDTAKRLYARHDFAEVTELRFDPARYGVKGLGVERQTVMVRGALGPDGVRRGVRSWDDAAAAAATKGALASGGCAME